jgi:hypothetical protein
MPHPTLAPNFRPSLLVTSLQAVARSILISMGMDHAFVDFLTRAAVGAAAVFLVILFVGLGIPRRSAAGLRRIKR